MPECSDDVCTDFRGLNGMMPQQCVDVSDIGAAFDQVAGETATQEVRRNRPVDLCPYGSLSHHRLYASCRVQPAGLPFKNLYFR